MYNVKLIFGTEILILFLIASIFGQEPVTLHPKDSDVMALARDRYISDLPFEKKYRPGKYTSWGKPAPGKQATVLELKGPGILTRIWNTYYTKDQILKIYIYVDDQETPVLAGPIREVAVAAQRLSCPEVPWGGFLDGRSVSLYLPIPFEKSLRIDAGFQEKMLDGPYWQVDYQLGIDPGPFVWKQEERSDGIHIIPTQKPKDIKIQSSLNETFSQEFQVSTAPSDMILDGPAVIRRLTLTSDDLDKLQLRISFDRKGGYEEKTTRVDHVNFQVDAPLKYLVSNFITAGIERVDSTAIIYFPMPFRQHALMQLQYIRDEVEFGSRFKTAVTIEYEKNPSRIEEMYYFNAIANTEVANGYDDFEVLKVRGQGHFVGVHLFDTNHDHGGGDNIFFDAGLKSVGQLHGICAEDYFHHAYMRIGVSAPYIHCPAHSARCRHHIESPIPFQESFTFNWGSFAGVMPKAVALWYQKELIVPEQKDLAYRLTGPFRMNQFDQLAPNKPVPDQASVKLFFYKEPKYYARKTWLKWAQNSFVDLCHAFRQYTGTIPPFSGFIDTDCCIIATTQVWVAKDAETEFIIGCDDPIRVYLEDRVIGESKGIVQPDPYRQFSSKAVLKAGLNTITVIVGNTENTNWHWNGFSLVLKNILSEGEMKCVY